MRNFSEVLVTGGAGFIGVNFIHYLLRKPGFGGRVVNLDKLTYAGNLLSLENVARRFGGTRYFFEKGDIGDAQKLEYVLGKYNIDAVVHFAAESHVDRSIHGPADFIQTNVVGTFTLLETLKRFWRGKKDVLFHHVSTDEVFGSLGETGFFTETTPYHPRSPYSASKAAADHLSLAYFHTYGIPVTVTNSGNNYGPYQFPEKLIPLVITNIQEGKPLPVYGDGKNVRDWLFVDDHVEAIWKVMTEGRIGETYNIGGECELPNNHVVNTLCEVMAKIQDCPHDYFKPLITHVKDRAGHDRRYAIDCSKIKKELSWKPSTAFEDGVEKTVRWYLANRTWSEAVRSGEYREWMKKNYQEMF